MSEPLRHRWADGAVWWDCPGIDCPACNPSPINPAHYRQHPSGLECIEVTEHLSFCEGNAVKYLWRHGLKQDLEKARWYLERAIQIPRPYFKCLSAHAWFDWRRTLAVCSDSDNAINEILNGQLVGALATVEKMLSDC
jgi:hypothetical protein